MALIFSTIPRLIAKIKKPVSFFLAQTLSLAVRLVIPILLGLVT